MYPNEATHGVAALWIASRFERHHVWELVDDSGADDPEATERDRERAGEARAEKQWPLRKLVTATVTGAFVILIAGVLLATSADEIATRTGLGSAMIGFLLVALSTALPEISSVTAAVRLRQYDMVVGDVFGTNLFNLALIFLADLVYDGEPILELAGTFEVVGSLLAVLLTGIFLVGLLRRRPMAIFRMGHDSLIALIVFAIGIAALASIGG